MNYIYNTRFQPFSNENIEELKWLIKKIREDDKDDKIIFGIVNPSPNNPDEKDFPLNWKRFRIQFNPLTYWQRYQSIKLIIKSLNCENRVSGIVPMPRPSVNMNSAYNFLPPRSERKICIPVIFNDALEDTKVEGVKNQGEDYQIIPANEFDPQYRIISPELITCLIALGYKHWEQFVPPVIRSYIKSVGIVKSVTSVLSYADAEEEINKIYSQMKEDILKNEMEKLFKDYLNITIPNLQTRKLPIVK